MAYKFNPFTGTLDLVNDAEEPTVVPSTPDFTNWTTQLDFLGTPPGDFSALGFFDRTASGGTTALLTGTSPGRLGGRVLTINAVSSDAALLQANLDEPAQFGTDDLRFGAVIKLNTLTTATEDGQVAVGFVNGTIGAATNGVFFLLEHSVTGGNWYGVNDAGISLSTIDLGVAQQITDYVKLEVEYLNDADGAGTPGTFFYINDVKKNTLPLTTNISTSDLGLCISTSKMVSAASTDFSVNVVATWASIRTTNWGV